MLGWLAAAILGGLLFGHMESSGPDWVEVYARARPSVLPLQEVKSGEHVTVCSVVVIDANIPFLLGASHCRKNGNPQFVEGIPMRVVYQEGDLMALVTQGRHDRWRSISIRQDYPQTGEDVAAIGYAYGGEHPSIMTGTIANRADLLLDRAFAVWAMGNERRAWIYLNIDLWHGVSGGLLVDAKGRMLTLNSRAGSAIPYSPASVAIAARPDVVRAFIEKARKAAQAARDFSPSRSSQTPAGK